MPSETKTFTLTEDKLQCLTIMTIATFGQGKFGRTVGDGDLLQKGQVNLKNN